MTCLTARIPGQQPVRVDLEQMLYRVLQSALIEADARYWLRRAAVFDAARPQPGDYTGKATDTELAQRDQRCARSAEACRLRAEQAATGRYPSIPEIAEVFQ